MSRKRFYWPALIVLTTFFTLVSMTIALADMATPSITSDKADYAPGETVVLTGAGWQVAEAVHINVDDSLGKTWSRDVDVTADDQGAITDTFQLPSSFVAVYTVTATGEVSGTATTTFTDGNVASWSGQVKDANTNLPISGATVSCTTSSGCNVNLSTTTDASGNYFFDGATGHGPKLTFAGNGPVTLTLTASKSGYTPATQTRTGLNNQATVSGVDFLLTAACTPDPITGPAHVGITYGDNATFTVAGVSDRQWQVSTNLGTSFTDISGETNASLTLTKPTVAMTGYEYRVVGEDSCGGSITTGAATLTVDPADQTIAFPAISDKAYGDADFDPGATASSGLPVSYSASGNCTIVSGMVRISGAGSCTVTASQSGNGNYNAATDVSQSFNIAKANANCVVNGYDVPYDTLSHIATGSCTGIGGEVVGGLELSGTTHKNAGTYNDSWSLSNANYQASGTVVDKIEKVDATCTVTGYTGYYDGASHGASGSCTGIGGESAGTLNLGASFTNVPGGTAHWTFTGNGNYKDQEGDRSIVINPVEVTVTASSPTVTYGDDVPDITPSYSGFITGEDENVLTTDPTCSTTYTQGSGVSGSYSTSCTGAVATNYTFKYVPGSVTVNPATVNITASSPTVTYGDPVPTIDPIYSGWVLGEGPTVLTTAPACSTTYTQGSGVSGSPYATSCSGAAADNYTFTYTGGTVTVNKAALTVTADSKSVYFGQPDPAFTFKYSGFVLGQDASVIDTAPTCGVSGAHTAVGDYTIACSGGQDDNYSFTYVNGTLHVLAWTLTGFYQPVDMNGVLNTVKGGSTVPLKFEIFAGPVGTNELTSTSSVFSFTQTKIACDGSMPTDQIEVTTTGGTSLRYDTVAGQFIQNWQTPKSAGQCYKVTMTTLDGSALVALFKLK